jgi:hypothetical protein
MRTAVAISANLDLFAESHTRPASLFPLRGFSFSSEYTRASYEVKEESSEVEDLVFGKRREYTD